MKNDMLELIEKHLPNLVGEQLKDQLSKIEPLKAEVQSLKEKEVGYLKKIEEYQNKLRSQEAVSKDNLKNIEEAKKLNIQKTNLTIQKAVLDVELRCAQEKVELAKECVAIPFRNRQLRETVLKNEVTRNDMVQESYSCDSNGNQFPPSVTHSEDVVPVENSMNREES